MCCTSFSTEKAQRKAAQANARVQTTQVQPVNSNSVSNGVNFANDNINSQRAAIVNSQNYHKRQFGRTG